MKGNGALVNIKDVIEVGDKHLINHDRFIVNWQMGVFCNYNCSYCWPGAHSDKYDYKKLSEYKIHIDNLVDVALQKNLKTLDITLLGGELTAYKQFPELVQYLDQITEIDVYLSIVSNISPSISYWKNFFGSLKNISMSLIASYHIEFADIDSFLEKARYINSSYDKLNFIVTTVMSVKNFERLKPSVDKIKSSGLYFKFNRETSNDPKMIIPYTKEMLEYISKINTGDVVHNFRIKTKNEVLKGSISLAHENNILYFKGWNCIAGSESIVVDAKGDVFRCWSDKTKSLGNIRTGFRLEQQKCNIDSCTKNADLCVKKWRN